MKCYLLLPDRFDIKMHTNEREHLVYVDKPLINVNKKLSDSCSITTGSLLYNKCLYSLVDHGKV